MRVNRFPGPGIRPILALVVFTLSAPAVRAQDSNYWTLQYGPVAELLGGVVVGSSRDLSATYYNPGALALAKDPSLLASVESFEVVSMQAQATPPVLDFHDLRLRPAPTLFAFALPRSRTGSHTLAVSALTRQNLDLRLDNWLVVPSRQAGAEALLDQSLTESWFGLTWAHPAGNEVGLGLTTYVAYRGQRSRREVSGEAAATGGAALLVEDYDYSNYRLLWKVGVGTRRGSWDLGLTATTPGVRLFGSGTASYTRSAVGADLGGGSGVEVNVQHQEDLESRYDSPWSVAGGAAFHSGRSTIHATAEWFAAVDAFDALDTAPFAADPAGQSLSKRLRQQARSVTNFGLGYQHRSSERFSYYGALTTDFTFADKNDSGGHSISTWDIYHVAAGTSLMVGSVKLTLGAAYAFGSDPRTVSAIQVPPGGRPTVGPVLLDVKYNELKFLLGFDFGR
jgi:hypothetical protein